jgi:hypothetical protein
MLKENERPIGIKVFKISLKIDKKYAENLQNHLFLLGN